MSLLCSTWDICFTLLKYNGEKCTYVCSSAEHIRVLGPQVKSTPPPAPQSPCAPPLFSALSPG